MYHIAVNGVQQGPLSEAEVREKIARGEVKPADVCWQAGWSGWRPVGEVFPATPGGGPPPLPAAPVATGAAKPPTSGLAVASLVCGICTIVLFPLFFLFMIPAVVCGHVAHSKIKQAKGALAGGGLALAGLIMGYAGIVMVPVAGIMAAAAIPAFQKVRQNSLATRMDNDARQLAAAAQQYFLETDETVLDLTYDAKTGRLGGPIASWVSTIGRGYSQVPTRLTPEGTFEMAHPQAGRPRRYDAEGDPVP